MSDSDIMRFAIDRENLLRLTQNLLETHKSSAASAEDAIRERIESLRFRKTRKKRLTQEN